MTVFPSLARSDRIPTTECAVCESSPDVGSSRTAATTNTNTRMLDDKAWDHPSTGWFQPVSADEEDSPSHCLHVVWLLQGPEVLGE